MDQHGTNHHLVIVEDDPGACRALATFFSRCGWTVRTGGSVAEAVRLLDLDPKPDALILDLMLPDGNGETVLRKVREAGLPTRVTVYTGSTDTKAFLKVRALKPDLLLIKPVGAEALCKLCEGEVSPFDRR
jgi:two-component system OmpR family response regulator